MGWSSKWPPIFFSEGSWSLNFLLKLYCYFWKYMHIIVHFLCWSSNQVKSTPKKKRFRRFLRDFSHKNPKYPNSSNTLRKFYIPSIWLHKKIQGFARKHIESTSNMFFSAKKTDGLWQIGMLPPGCWLITRIILFLRSIQKSETFATIEPWKNPVDSIMLVV